MEPRDAQGGKGLYPYAAVVVTVAMLSGFVNLIPVNLGGFYAATLCIDGTYLVMGWLVGMKLLRGHAGPRLSGWVFALGTLTYVFASLFVVSSEPLLNKVLSWRDGVLYVFIAVFIAFGVRERQELVRLLDLAMGLSRFLAAFGLVQFLLRDRLPSWLLASRDTEVYDYYGTDLTRANGLIGNTIVFSTVMLLFFALHVGRLVQRPSVKNSLATVLLAAGVLVSFSRTAIAGALVIAALGLVGYVFRAGFGRATLRGLAVMVAAVVAAVGYAVSPGIQARVEESFLVSGLFGGSNVSVQGSTDVHVSFIHLALDIFKGAPLLGAGIATQREDSLHALYHPVITDGWAWATLAQGGLVLSLAYLGLFVSCIIAVCRAAGAGQPPGLVFGFLAFTAYQLCFAVWVNSALLGKGPFIMYWVLFGIIAGIGRTATPGTGKQAVEAPSLAMRAGPGETLPPTSGSAAVLTGR